MDYKEIKKDIEVLIEIALSSSLEMEHLYIINNIKAKYNLSTEEIKGYYLKNSNLK